MRAQAQVHELAINPIIYAELSLAFEAVEALDAAVDQMRLTMAEVPRPALFLAGKAFLQYRRAGGRKSNVLSDFFVGAHAAVARCPLLTRDARRYHSYFPTVELIVEKVGSDSTFPDNGAERRFCTQPRCQTSQSMRSYNGIWCTTMS